jgi:inward rectifier potassium channel
MLLLCSTLFDSYDNPKARARSPERVGRSAASGVKLDAVAAKPGPVIPVRTFASSEERRRNIEVIGAPRLGLTDIYHRMLRATWLELFLVVAAIFLLLNALFGLAYFEIGGVAGAREGNYLDYFFFSVHTFGTIGYGSMYPVSTSAETLMTFEALISLFMTAVVTGMAFSKFARPTARVLWSGVACIADLDGIPTLSIRAANARMNHMVEASMRVAMLRTEVSKEGERFRRMFDMQLVRATSPSFILSWTVLHQIVPGSPLYGMTPEKLRESGSEIVLTLTGLDETLGMTIHARYSFTPGDLKFGARLSDILGTRTDGGKAILDYRRFHESLPAKLSWDKMGVVPAPVPDEAAKPAASA